MNRLRNSKLLAGLAVLVLALVAGGTAYWWPKRPVKRPTGPLILEFGAKVTNALAGASVASTNGLWPVAAIDLDAVQGSLARWTEAPQRDPFQLSEPIVPEVVPAMPSPVSQFKLRAIWQQTGGRAAVVNDRVLQEGESIAGCKLERIETDRVWFQGPEKMESLVFGQVPAPPPPPRVPLTRKLKGIFGPEMGPSVPPRL